MSPARRQRILAAYGHRCAISGCDVPGPFEIDHEQALARGGDDLDENLRPLCRFHHKRKTFGTKATTLGSDVFEVAKSRRLERKQQPRTRKHRWPSRKIAQRVNPWGKA